MTAIEPVGRTDPKKPKVRAVARTAALLNALHERGGVASMKDLGRLLNVPRSSLYDLVRPLIAAGWLKCVSDGTLAIGSNVPEIGRSALSLPRLPGIEDAVQKAASICHGTIVLSALDGGQTVALAVRSATDGPRVRVHGGDRLPPNWTLAGRMLASDLTDQHLRYFLSAHGRRRPEHPSRSLDDDAAEISLLRGQTIATTSGEPVPHLTTCALALRWDGNVAAAVAAIVRPESTSQARRAMESLAEFLARRPERPRMN